MAVPVDNAPAPYPKEVVLNPRIPLAVSLCLTLVSMTKIEALQNEPIAYPQTKKGDVV